MLKMEFLQVAILSKIILFSFLYVFVYMYLIGLKLPSLGLGVYLAAALFK